MLNLVSHRTISFGIRGTKVIFFPLSSRVYLLHLQWWTTSVSNSQGHPNKKTCLHWYNIAFGIILISTNKKVDTCCISYFGLATVVEPLNVVWMGVSTCHQTNIYRKISTHQVVATYSIDDGDNLWRRRKSRISCVVEASQGCPHEHSKPTAQHRF
jgi:hypothetical protein